jgi:5-methylcytosine-specific restriction endonuclease McrBC regulatory subunit McrC
LTTTGSCFYEASCFSSAEHVNGKSVDTSYKLDVNQDQKIINAMEKFHFHERFIGINPYFYKLSNAVNKDALHNTHLHS